MNYAAVVSVSLKSASISSKVLPLVSLVRSAITTHAPIRKGAERMVQTVPVGRIVKRAELAAIAITAETRKNALTPITELRIDAGEDSVIIRVVMVRILL